MKKTLFFTSVAIILIVLVFFFIEQRALAPSIIEETPDTQTFPEPEESSPEITNINTALIEVTTPSPNSTITSPMTLTGRARGTWYFEASFPIELRDANNVLLTTVVAQAQGEWMTEDFVPFTAPLTFPAQPTGSQGMLIFKKDNPSGEPQYDMMFDVPVVF